MKLRLTVERPGNWQERPDLAIEAEVHIDLAITDLRHLTPTAAMAAVDVLKHLLVMRMSDL